MEINMESQKKLGGAKEERSEKLLDRMCSVAIVLAIYNGEKYLQDQLDSLLRQTGVKVEILVRDDGSDDGTTLILDEYQNRKLIKWYAGEHIGVQKGYLDLLKHAPKADYYAFCDQDDVWDDDKLLCAVAELEQMPVEKPLIYYCGQRLVDENLNLLSIHNIDVRRSPYTNFLISNVAGCTAVFNKNLLDAVNYANPDFILMHDSWVFKVCLVLGGRYYADSSVHISYRQHGNNVAGLNGGIRGKIRQAKRYINTFKIQKQLQNLVLCYGDKMIPEYRQLASLVCDYDKSFNNWIRLLLYRGFNFRSRGLNCIVKIKIFMKKL